MAFHLPSVARKALRYVGFVLIALVVFVFALQMTFPYDRVKDKIIDALSEKYDVTIGDVERGIVPGRLYFKSFMLRTRAEKPEDVTAFFIERLEVDLGLVALIRGAASVNIDAKIGAGHLTGNITISKGDTKVDLDGSNLPSASLPMKEVLGLPMSGKLDLGVELELPNNANKAGKVGPDWTKAEGHFELACASGCTVGDGKSKLKLKAKNASGQAFAKDGVEFGTVRVDTLAAKVEIKGGKLDVTKFELKSPDGEVHVDFSVTLAQDFNESLVAGCLRFKGTPELEKREPKTAAELTTTGAPKGPDGLFHIRLDGKFKEMRRLGQVCGQAAAGAPGMDDMSGGVRRAPNLPPPAPEVRLTPATPAVAPPPPVTPPPPPPPPATPAAAGSATPAPGAPPTPEAPADPNAAGSATAPASGP